MTYTILTLILVGFILLFWLYNLMYNCFSRSFCILKNRNSGSITTKDASIISVTTIKKGKKPLVELLVLFENFSGHHIHRKIRVWDSKPQLNRFQPDKTIPIGLNIARKPKDPVFLSQKMCRFSFMFVIICSLKTVLYVTGCYIIMGEIFGRVFSEPDRYEHVFKSSNTWQIGLIFIGISIFLYLLLQKIGVLVTGKTMGQNWNLLYYGIGTTARVSEYRDTGTFKTIHHKKPNSWKLCIFPTTLRFPELPKTWSLWNSTAFLLYYLWWLSSFFLLFLYSLFTKLSSMREFRIKKKE